jgi:hypothetical protein
MGGQDKEVRKMKKKIIGICVMILLITTMFSMNVTSSYIKYQTFNHPIEGINVPGPEDEEDQDNHRFDKWYGVYGNNVHLAQSIKPSKNVITRVMLPVCWRGNPEGLEISIRKKLNGNDLTSIYVEKENIEKEKFEFDEYVVFDFQDILIEPNEIYYIIWTPHGSLDRNNIFFWGIKDGNYYKSGEAWKFLGETWEIVHCGLKGNPDFSFFTYGKNNTSPTEPTQPLGPTVGIIGEELTYQSRFNDVDGDTLEIIFDWGDGTNTGWIEIGSNYVYSMSHLWSKNGSYEIKTKSKDNFEESSWSEPLIVLIGNVAPEKPQSPSGPNSGKIRFSYTYSTSTIDVNDDKMFFQWNWGDNNEDDWIGPFESGQICEVNHKWTQNGDYDIRVRAKDEYGATSEWSDPLSISMPKNKVIQTPFLQFLENLLQNHPHLFPLLRQLLGL